MVQLIHHCHPSSIGAGSSTGPCRLEYRKACLFAHQLNHECLLRESKDTNGRHAASVYEYDTLMHFRYGHAHYCYCKKPFDSFSRLGAHRLQCTLELNDEEACSPLTFISTILPQLNFDADIVQPVKGREHGFGVHLAGQLRDPKYQPAFLTCRPYFPIPPRRPRVWFVFRDSPPAPWSKIYLTESRLHDIRTYLDKHGFVDDTTVFTLHLKASSRTFPFVNHDGSRATARDLLRIGDETWKEWQLSLWYTSALADGLFQDHDIPSEANQDAEYDHVVSSYDGFTSSVAQMGMFLAVTHPVIYTVAVQKDLINERIDAEWLQEAERHEDVDVYILEDEQGGQVVFRFHSKLLQVEIKKFLAGDPVDTVYEPLLEVLYAEQDKKDNLIPRHRTTNIQDGKAKQREWKAGTGTFKRLASATLEVLEHLSLSLA